MNPLQKTLDAIDASNSVDPDISEGTPAALLYGQRMTSELDRLFPDAPASLKAAARGQHIERWILKRSDYSDDRAGYLTWRRDLAEHHANRVGEIMAQSGFEAEDIDAASRMLRKQGIKRDPLVQALEDVICFVFLKWYFAGFASTQPEDKLVRIVEKTARKMSADARARVLEEFELPEDFASAFR